MSEILGEELLSLEDENTSNFERQNTIGKPMNSTPALEENDVTNEENVMKYRESKASTAELICAIDYSRRLELFETACKVFALPMEVRHLWSRISFFPWFRATLTS